MGMFTVNKAPRAVSSILGAFQNTISQLEKAAEDHQSYAEQTKLEAQRLQRESEESIAESIRATTAARKLTDLISGDKLS